MKVKSKKLKGKSEKSFETVGLRLRLSVFAFLLLPFAFSFVQAQTETPPAPSAPRAVKIPAVQEKELPNGLKIVVVERKNVPLATVSLLVKSGANVEDEALAGVADLTASLLLKGTKTRSATQIAEEMEFLGGNINSGANWNASNVTVNVTSDKLDKALAIMSDVILNPTFSPKEIELYKTQTLDNLNVQLKQPSSLAGFVASRYSFDEHSAIGTPESLKRITQANILKFYREAYLPTDSVLIFTGDISADSALSLAKKYFSNWKSSQKPTVKPMTITQERMTKEDRVKFNQKMNIANRFLVIDLPNSGQAAVTYAKKLDWGRGGVDYYPALVANTVLGGGYSARLNQEIRIKRGLSYGASSSLNWRPSDSNFLARAQTKNISAAQVAELVAAEMSKLTTDSVLSDELTPRKLTLTGNFGRSLETTTGLAAQIGELYLYGIPTGELNSYMTNVQNISDEQVKNFALGNLKGGDIIIVGDAKSFMDDLKKRFPNQKIEVIKADELDLSKKNLRK
ncbi:MAG: M16 family metallopeptidase [Pyrinomonadaceae bacterium]